MDIFKDMPYGIEEIITNRMIASVAVSPAGTLIPLLDTGAIFGIWADMLYEIGKYHDVTFTTAECAKIITAGSSCYLGYLGGSKAFTFLLNLIPGLGTLGAMAANVVLNGYYTYAIGKAFHLMLNDYDINGKTLLEIGKILQHVFVPIPSWSTVKEVYNIMKENLL